MKPTAAASSAYTTVPLDLEPKPLIVAEEMNTTTRMESFRNMVRAGDYDGILTLAKKLVNDGSHMLDLCCAVVGEDEKAYMSNVLEKIATRVPAPILIDTTEAEVLEEALKRTPGKAIINSINLEDGEKRSGRVLPMAKRYGAAVIALTIDEDGMALTAEKKDRHCPAHLRPGGKQVRTAPAGFDLRRADPADLDRAGGLPLGGQWRR